MDITELSGLLRGLPLAVGYHYECLRPQDVDSLIEALPTWYPDIRVGAASCFLRREFYAERVCFEGRTGGDVYVLLLRHGAAMAGMFSWDIDRDSMAVYGRLGVAAPGHRGTRMAQSGLELMETFGRRVGAGLLYGLATLRHRHTQDAFERASWSLVGITPGYDREMVAPGTIKRVYEAVYAKVIVSPAALLHPQQQHMTPATQALFQHLFEPPRTGGRCTVGSSTVAHAGAT